MITDSIIHKTQEKAYNRRISTILTILTDTDALITILDGLPRIIFYGSHLIEFPP